MQVHADLSPSRIQPLIEIALYGVVALLTAFSPLPRWMIVCTVLTLLAVYLYQRCFAVPRARLVQLIQLDLRDWCWYDVPAGQPSSVTRRRVGTLQHVRRIGWVMALDFRITTDPGSHTVRWLIWRDQVDADNWRRLQVLLRFWTDPVSTS